MIGTLKVHFEEGLSGGTSGTTRVVGPAGHPYCGG